MNKTQVIVTVLIGRIVKKVMGEEWILKHWVLNNPSGKRPAEWKLFVGELIKIKRGQEKGHVASYEEGLEYLKWRDKHAS